MHRIGLAIAGEYVQLAKQFQSYHLHTHDWFSVSGKANQGNQNREQVSRHENRPGDKGYIDLWSIAGFPEGIISYE